MANNTLLPDRREDQDLAHDPSQADYDKKFNDIAFNEITGGPELDDLRNMEDGASQQPSATNPESRQALTQAEKNPHKPSGKNEQDNDNPMSYSPGKTKVNKSRFGRNRKLMFSLGAGGVGGGILAAFLLLLPLKMDALITNASEAAAKIPGYAVQERTEYLITRVLAVRMLQLTYSLDDKDIEPVFCQQRGNVGCSLLATYSAQRISDTLGIDMVKLPNQTVRVTINTKGRQSLGGYARSWEVKLTRDWGNQGVLETVKKIETHKEMRSYLKTKVNKTYKNTISRYVARRVLMLKYGVRSWRAFEATREKIDNKVADVKTAFKVGVYKNTIGKISPRFAAYLACLQGGTTTCEDLLKNLSSSLDPPGDGPKAGESQESYERRKKQYESLEKLGSKIRGEIPDVPTEGMLNSTLAKIFSTKALAAASGVLSAIMITDTVLKAVHAADEGVLDQVGFDMAAQVYTGFAFGDSTGIVTNWEKIKTGDLEGTTGAEVSSELGTLVDCDGSTLCAYENGYGGTFATALTPIAGAVGTGYSRECSTSEGNKQIVLAAGELVCPERKLYRNYAGLLVDNPAFKPLAQIASVWEASIGRIISLVGDAIGAATGWITEPIINMLKPALDKLSELAAPLINWLMDTVFNPPSVGYDTTPANNYDALSGALHLEQWELMKNGIVDGVVSGGGGQFISEADAQAILAYQKSEEQDSFNSQSTMAKLFNTSLKGSLIQQAVLQAPTNLTSLATFPGKAFATLFRLPFASAATAVTSSPFGLPNYSYKLNDPALTADPNTYTEAYCTESAAAREASLDKRPGATVKVYTKTDPCALEKLAVGALITQDNPSDQYAFPPLMVGNEANNSPSTCASGTDSVRKITRGWDKDTGQENKITLCAIPNTKADVISGWTNEKYQGTSSQHIDQIVVNAEASKSLLDAAQAYSKEHPGQQLSASVGYRSVEEQCSFFMDGHNTPSANQQKYYVKYCKPDEDWLAYPGGNWSTPVVISNHMMGYSIDFKQDSENWMRNCMQANSKGRCYGFYDDVYQSEKWDSAHFTYDPK